MMKKIFRDSMPMGVRVRRGFTMIELLVAMALLAVLVVMLLNLVDSGTKLWRDNENRVDSYREARAALGVISRDVANAVMADNTNYFLVNGDPNAFAHLSSVTGLETNVNTGGALLFLAVFPRAAQLSVNTNENRSDICEVGYFLAFGKTSAMAGSVNTNSINDTLNLYRYFLPSDRAYTNLVNNQVFSSPNPTLMGAETELLARNVTAFRVAAFMTNDVGNPIPYGPSSNTPPPSLLEISITAVNQETGKRLGNDKEAWLGTNSQIQRSSQTFTTRVGIP